MRRFVLAASIVAALAGVAAANGRPAGTSTIHFQQGNDQDIVAGMTFGVVISHDGGATWYWMCEKAVGYGGMYDPDYSYSQSGAIFATTFNGLKVMRDGCSFVQTPTGAGFCDPMNRTGPCTTDADCAAGQACTGEFVSTNELGPDHALYYGAADPLDAKVHKSPTDDGLTYPTVAPAGLDTTCHSGTNNGAVCTMDSECPGGKCTADQWWQSLRIAPSDPSRVYVAGYRTVLQCNSVSTNANANCNVDGDCMGAGAKCELHKLFLLYTSNNGGTSFTAMSTTGITASMNSVIEIVGISPIDPLTVYSHVTVENGSLGDGIYKSANAGTSWSKILDTQDPFGLTFLARANGSCVAATQSSGAQVSASCDTSWTPLASPPHINCLAENSAGEVWACTRNFDNGAGMPGDGYGIMKSSDLSAWTGVLKFADITAPVDCAVGTTQRDRCVEPYMGASSVWCCLTTQLGLTSTAIDCTGPRACGATSDTAGDGGPIVHPPGKGCCDASGGAPGALLLGLGAGAMLLRPRRRS